MAVEKGQTVIYSILGVHKRKDIWGEDADEFRPERWDGRKIDWSYVPFSGGPRICIGREHPFLALVSTSNQICSRTLFVIQDQPD